MAVSQHLVASRAAPVGRRLDVALRPGPGVPLHKVAPALGAVQGAPPVVGARQQDVSGVLIVGFPGRTEPWQQHTSASPGAEDTSRGRGQQIDVARPGRMTHPRCVVLPSLPIPSSMARASRQLAEPTGVPGSMMTRISSVMSDGMSHPWDSISSRKRRNQRGKGQRQEGGRHRVPGPNLMDYQVTVLWICEAREGGEVLKLRQKAAPQSPFANASRSFGPSSSVRTYEAITMLCLMSRDKRNLKSTGCARRMMREEAQHSATH